MSLIAKNDQLLSFLAEAGDVEPIALDTEADSLHCYSEKLCLVQVSIPGHDVLIDPLSGIDLAPFTRWIDRKKLILHGADFDVRMLMRAGAFTPGEVFDTMLAGRFLGYTEVGLAALVNRFFGVELKKGPQKANWGKRPLPQSLIDYAYNDTIYLLRISELLRSELVGKGRYEWFRQTCERSVAHAGIHRERDPESEWRIPGSSKLKGLSGVILRELWHWREAEAEAADVPPFIVLRNEDLLRTASSAAEGEAPKFAKMSERRRNALEEAVERARSLPEENWPKYTPQPRYRPTAEQEKRFQELKKIRDKFAGEQGIDPALIAPRAALELVSRDYDMGCQRLLPWQREVLGLNGRP